MSDLTLERIAAALERIADSIDQMAPPEQDDSEPAVLTVMTQDGPVEVVR